ncbi:hypothetical protein PENVUL_c006G01896 [Penicillium vulpinum]|uniref:Zn(2)-C6 fungal-type domain-containing protein n=1 Tax=Penicillium vulpinum TaxID=29845 RepID=A0A1V6S7E5_9EURO|nr:hypothetical protein PENVUL_c006G01896 [Penicillium vulpinum]
MTSTSNNLSLTACVHCRRHKIRCSRQFPDCGRCSRLGLTCDYPNPPDRRQIANLRNGPLYNDDSSANLHGNESINCTKTSHGDHVSSSSIIPPTEVMIQLIDIYFDCVFNANLLFHRPSFMEDLEKGSIKEHVLLSVISVASILSRSAHSPSGTSIESPSRHWAEIASASALQSADCGGLDVVQACENLALYWWATNEPHRAHVHSNALPATFDFEPV